jgi:hypothetical protein
MPHFFCVVKLSLSDACVCLFLHSDLGLRQYGSLPVVFIFYKKKFRNFRFGVNFGEKMVVNSYCP